MDEIKKVENCYFSMENIEKLVTEMYKSDSMDLAAQEVNLL